MNLAELEATISETVSPEEFYRKMADLGLNYGPSFQTIESLRCSTTEVLAHLKTSGDVRGYTIPPTYSMAHSTVWRSGSSAKMTAISSCRSGLEPHGVFNPSKVNVGATHSGKRKRAIFEPRI